MVDPLVNFSIGSYCPMDDLNFQHDQKNQRFLVLLPESNFGELNYNKNKNILEFYHIQLPLAFRGKGIGEKLARFAFLWAKNNNFQVDPICTYIQSYVQSKGSEFLSICILDE